jgi:hypothetical protein
MIGKFSKELYKFARSVDIVDEDIWEKVMNGSFTEFLNAQKVVRTAGYLTRQYRDLGRGPDWCLHSVWWAKGEGFKGAEFSRYLQDLDECHTVFSFARQKRIWVVSKDKKPLHEDTAYLDLLDKVPRADAPRIPRFKLHPEETPYVYTSICYPDNRGVLNLELKQYVKPEEDLIESIRQLAASVDLLYRAYQFRRKSRTTSIDMIGRLNQCANELPHTYFISYAREDTEAADQVELFLRRKKRNVLRDEHDIEGGQVITEAIRKKINESDTFIGLWSENFIKSNYCRAEHEYASNRALNNYKPFRIILFALDNAKPDEYSFGDRLYCHGEDRDKIKTSIDKITDEREEERKILQ